jgi:hypothetical protein
MSSQPGRASCRSSERRAEIDLAPLDPVAIDHEELGVAPSPAVGLLELVGDEDLTVVFDDLLEAEGLDLLAVRPAAFEVSASVKVWIGWAAERKVLGDDGLSQFPVVLLLRRVQLADDIRRLRSGHFDLLDYS